MTRRRIDGAHLTEEGRALVEFGRASRHVPVGFAWLDDRGAPVPTEPVHTWISTRMTHVFALASELGVPGTAELAAHGVRSLATVQQDPDHDGWYAAVEPDGSGPVDPAKSAYPHAFVALAAASATAAEIPGASDLLNRATEVLTTRFLRDGRVVEQYDVAFTTEEAYRGANASMHMVEALLAVGDLLGEQTWHRTALGIAEHLVHEVARAHDFLMPEHFTADWRPRLEYNAERPADPFRPYGVTPGHLLEWARLLLHLEAALPTPPDWLLTDARSLFETAVRTGWSVDGHPGFVYTVDWDGRPVVRTRMHWVVTEAILAAAALHHRTDDADYERWYRIWWAHAREHFLDPVNGSWHHELDAENRPGATVWRGKPDVYHAFQATLLPSLDLAPVPAVQLARRS